MPNAPGDCIRGDYRAHRPAEVRTSDGVLHCHVCEHCGVSLRLELGPPDSATYVSIENRRPEWWPYDDDGRPLPVMPSPRDPGIRRRR